MKFGILFILLFVRANCELTKTSDEDVIVHDCAVGSLNNLPLPDLLVHANKSDECLQEARSAFKKKHADDWFTITGPFVENGENAFEDGVIKMIRNIDVAKDFLRAFGKYVYSIGVYFTEIDESEGKEIVKYIDMCSDSMALKRLTLDACKGNVLDELNSTFPSVETVSFSSTLSGQSIDIRPNAPTLADIFPRTKTLRFAQTAPSDWDLIGKTFPRLGELEVTLRTSADETTNLNDQVLNFLENNSKITKLIVGRSNLKFLKEVNDILPKLRHLELGPLSDNYNYLNYQGDPIRFKQVETLKFRTYFDDVYPDHIHFDHLFELKLYVREFTRKWTQFVHNQTNVNLSILALDAETLTNDQILSIAEKKPNLREAKIASDSNITADTIIEFIEHSEHLHRLELVVLISQDEIHLLQDKIGKDWDADDWDQKVLYSGKTKLTLVRKEVELEEDPENDSDDDLEFDTEDAPEDDPEDSPEDNSEEDPEGNGSTALDLHSMTFLTTCFTFVLFHIF